MKKNKRRPKNNVSKKRFAKNLKRKKLKQKGRKREQELILQKNAADAKNGKTMWKGTTSYGEPFFDIDYWTKKNPYYKDGVSPQTSKEMMRYFLECVGGDDPSTYSQNGMNRKSTTHLWFAWDKLLGKSDEVEIVNTPIEPFRWFAELEPLITNDKMWWVLMKGVWTYNSSFFTNECLYRYGRMKVPFKDRTKRMGYLDVVDGVNLRKKGHFTSESVNESYDRMDDDETLYVYRSFIVEKGKNVREGLLKNSPYAHRQENGAGWSFTEHKSIAIRIADPINADHFDKYRNMDENDALDTMEKVLGLGKRVKNYIKYRKGFRSCLASYRIKKKDILFYTDALGEREIVVHPRNVDLVDYRFLDIIDYCAIMTTKTKGSGFLDDEKFSASVFANNDAFYDLMHRSVKEVFTRKPNIIRKILSTNETGLRELSVCVDDVLEDDLGIQLCEIESGQKVGFWYLGNERCVPISKGVRQRTTAPTMDTKSLYESLGAFQSFSLENYILPNAA
jgi:hypothetical protein